MTLAGLADLSTPKTQSGFPGPCADGHPDAREPRPRWLLLATQTPEGEGGQLPVPRLSGQQHRDMGHTCSGEESGPGTLTHMSGQPSSQRPPQGNSRAGVPNLPGLWSGKVRGL